MRMLCCSECGHIPSGVPSLGEICAVCQIGAYRLLPEADVGDTSLLGRMRVKLERAKSAGAVAVDVDDLREIVGALEWLTDRPDLAALRNTTESSASTLAGER